MSVEIVALDIGGVLATIDKSPMQTLAKKNHTFCKILFDEDFIRLQRGYIDPHGFFLKKSVILNVALPILRNAFAAMIIATAQKILSRINVDYFFISNINEVHFETFLAQIHATDFSLKNSCLSCRHGYLKPEDDFFKKAMGGFDISPKKILFLDDKKENITAAIRAGFTAVQCSSSRDLENVLSCHGLI